MATTVLAFSGGLAATVLLWDLRAKSERVRCLYVDFGQPCAGQELAAADRIVRYGNRNRKEGTEVDLSCVTLAGLARTHQPTHGLVRRRDFEFFGLPILCMAAAQAVAVSAETLACGTRAETEVTHFAPAWANLIGICSRSYLGYYAPYVERDAGWVLSHGDQLGAPLADTWSCLVGGQRHCGTCRGCKARQQAFLRAGLIDLTTYAVEPPRNVLPFRRPPDQPKGVA